MTHRQPGDPDALRDRVAGLLARPGRLTLTRSPDPDRVAVLAEPVMPTAGPDPHRTLCVTGPDHQLRQVPLPGPPVGEPAWAPGAATLAGYAMVDDHLHPWVYDLGAATVTVLDALPGDPGATPPIAWVSPGCLVVASPQPTPAPTAPDREPLVFEAAPSSRVRVLPPVRPAPPVAYALRLLFPATGRTVPVAAAPRPWRSVRPCPCGRHLACADDTNLVVLGLADGSERTPVTESPIGAGWVGPPDGERLFLVAADDPGGCTVHEFRPDGATTRIGRLPGVAGSVRPGPHGLDILVHDPETGVPAVLATVVPATGRAVLREWPLAAGSALPGSGLELVRHGPAGPCLLMRRDTRRGTHLRLLRGDPIDGPGGGPLGGSLTVRGQAHLPSAVAATALSGEDGVAILVPAQGRPRVVRLLAPADVRRPGPVLALPAATPALDLGDPAGDGHARINLYLPAGDVEPVATVVSIYPRMHRPGTSHPGRRTAPPVEHLGWLTRLDVAVVMLDLSLRWWPDLPDEQIRPWIANAVRGAVTAGPLARYVDPRRLAVAGHSFAATLALLALADTDLFAAGLVSSGAYCRSLTPLGFQYERRTLWEAGRVYRDFDAIASAPGIRRPTLIVHGTEDRNPATPVDQAVLLFQALTALGTPSRLVLLPGEAHHIGSREALSRTLTEQVDWLHRWVGAAAPASSGVAVPASPGVGVPASAGAGVTVERS